METVTAQDVVNKRMAELYEESVVVSNQIKDDEALLKEIEARLAGRRRRLVEIGLEVEILETYQDRRIVKVVREEYTITEHLGRKSRTDRLDFESSLIAVFSGNGRNEMSIGELIDQLADMGWKWNTYKAAYNYLMQRGMLEKVERGTYRLLR